MILIDTQLRALEASGSPIRVGMVGAGFMGQGLANHLLNTVRGMRLVAISNRSLDRAVQAYTSAGRPDVARGQTLGQLEDAIRAGQPAVTEDALLLARSEQIDVLVDATGAVEFGARVALEAFQHKKHVVLMNAELDATIGPILQAYAEQAGVILTACEGDEPGVEINLYRWVKGLGLIPRVLGSVKGLQDRYRNPTTQQGFAKTWGQNPALVTSFADGSKISFEQAIVANATGFGVQHRGMSGGREYREDVLEIGRLYDIEELRRLGGIVDYVVGTPHTKVYCLAEHPDPKQRRYLELYKMGKGPLYAFFWPYHLVHFEVPNAIARAVLFRDPVARPLGGPVVEVCAVAKRDLTAGEILDGYAMYMTYGEAVNAAEMSLRQYLPEGLVEGCRLLRPVAKDQVLVYHDVQVPAARVADRLRAEQYRHFRWSTWLEDHLARPAQAGQIA
jgi:predicted homoserine dehydrogenase-like protein